MKIISKFRDYYDSAQGWGTDPKLIYIREQNEIPLTIEIPSKKEHWNEDIKLEHLILGFCGQLYPFIKVEYRQKGGDWFDRQQWASIFFYDLNEFLKSPYAKILTRHWRGEENLKKMFADYSRPDDKLFTEIALAPVFLIQWNGDSPRTSLMTTNPELKPLGFPKMKDAFTAFQEISMYVGNQLVKENKPLEIEDKYRIAGHGFDKNSFRNPIRLKDLK